MVNEIADKIEDNKNENEPWTITLGKHVLYNPSPFKDKNDLLTKTILIAVVLVLGAILLYYIPILGILIIGSTLFCYGLSFYETRLLEKETRHELR
jgi:hypothetical protein